MHRLAHVVAQRNVRAVLFDLTSCHHSLQSTCVAVPALVKCGFRVGLLTSTASETFASADKSVYCTMAKETFAQDAAAFLQVSTDRTVTFQPRGSVTLADAVLANVHFDTPNEFVDELLGFPHALDPQWTQFGPFPIRLSEVFYTSPLSIGLVNLKPIVPGHVLVIPKRRVARFLDLDADEVADLWHTAQLVAKRLQQYYAADAYTFSIQDGPVAGQTVPHCHVHVLPRRPHDFAKNDEIYDHLGKQDATRPFELDPDDHRVRRSLDEMAAEAAVLREILSK
ncbi:hypothetical protein H310_08762 [Aphanomyces invadans]|uniref:HIT domain-containing protein n=1 Tax=Aphanomyces invadans TaxID=157072 RepID=A0A024TX96_9STRA|nr:hypothetical protein H310_08762 [Aphanomyces invadans]ETV98648.1 hypothetical protein H310_08762 [Aphanomyces invadans]|eukprot:XP_008872845.1 hypothetical protein H310_08762 [Aphanomyces invadans]